MEGLGQKWLVQLMLWLSASTPNAHCAIGASRAFCDGRPSRTVVGRLTDGLAWGSVTVTGSAAGPLDEVSVASRRVGSKIVSVLITQRP
ncbi:hypothetical protein AcV5_005675 [Taiwanofungus camphoratus]|nr:hypothetical protein AcV5_005675 [Antrodia cinnamomea]